MSDLYQMMVENRLRIEAVKSMLREIVPVDECGLTREKIQTVTKPLWELSSHMTTLENQHVSTLQRDAVKEILEASQSDTVSTCDEQRFDWVWENVDTFFGDES